MPIFAHINEESSFLHTLSVTDGKKFAFAVFGFRNKIDLAGPARIADHRDAKKNGGEAQPSSARIFSSITDVHVGPRNADFGTR